MQSPDDEGWQPCVDAETKEQFWVNHRTKQVSMVQPPCLRTPPAMHAGARSLSFDRIYAGTHSQEKRSAGGWISADAMEQLKVPSGPNSNSSVGALSSGIMEGPSSPFMAEQHNSKDVSIDLVVLEGQTKGRNRSTTSANRKSETNSRRSPQVIAGGETVPESQTAVSESQTAVSESQTAVSESQTAVSENQFSPTAGGGVGKRDAGRGVRSLIPKFPKLFKKTGETPSIPPTRGITSDVLGEINHGEVAC